MGPDGARPSEDGRRVLLDVNALAIALVDDHPGHEYVAPHVESGIAGETRLLTFDYFPLRAQYLMTASFGVSTVDARNGVQSFLRQPLGVVSANRETILAAYEISAEKNHDVYDGFIVALAREHDADAILTTDTDFEHLCSGELVDYLNPVPDAVLADFEDIAG
jgi:predicted nucleic acid-binding protein